MFLPRLLENALQGKRLIFTVTTGRSGTGYLARILRLIPGIAAFHEPKPEFSEVMREGQRNARAAYDFLVNVKLPAIAREPSPIYIETGHLFCKGFLEPLLELGVIPDLIILTRPYRQVALSLYQLQTIPGRTESGLKWCLSPEDPGVLALPAWQDLHSYQLCFWYCLEIERRSQAYERLLLEHNARVVHVSVAEVSSVRGIRKLIRQLDLPKLSLRGWWRYFRIRNKRVNTKTHAKFMLPLPKDVDRLERKVLSIVQRT